MLQHGIYQKLKTKVASFCQRLEGRIEWEKIRFRFFLKRQLRFQVKVYDSHDTIEHILKTRCSVSRYGDGEFDMIIQMVTDGKLPSISGFQSYNQKLAQRLKEIVEEKEYDDCLHIVCIPFWYHANNVKVYKPSVQRFCKRYICEKLPYILSIINKERVYFNANISRFYLSYKDKSHCLSYVNNIKRIWYGRDVCFIEGEYSRLGVGNDLFHGSKTITRILCPSKDAYSKYDEIMQVILQKVDKSTLLILALGHTATVMAYDLSKYGYQALDLGHIDVEYEWMLSGAQAKMPLKNKYVNEVPDGEVKNSCDDLHYNNQVIARVL